MLVVFSFSCRFYVHVGGVEFSLVFMSDTSTIAVALDGQSSPLYQDVLQFLRNTLNNMLQSFPWMRALRFDFCIRCPICVCSSPCKKHNQADCHRDSCVHLIPEMELIPEGELPELIPRCERSTKLNNVIPVCAYSYWFPRQERQVSSHALQNNAFKNSSFNKNPTENAFIAVVLLILNL